MLRISYLFLSLKQHTFAHSPFNHDHDQQALSYHQPRVRPSSSFQIRGNNNPAHSGRYRETRATLTTCNEVKIPAPLTFENQSSFSQWHQMAPIPTEEMSSA